MQVSVPTQDETVDAHRRIAGLITAADGMVDGLDRPAPDDGTFRREQLALFKATAAQIQNEVKRL